MNENLESWHFKRLWFGGQSITMPNGAVHRQWLIRLFGREWTIAIISPGKV